MALTQRHLLRSFLLLLLASTAAPAVAADSYLKVVPGTALAWGAVNHMNEASEKIQKLATVVQAPAVSVLDLIKKESGLEKGLDEKGAAGFFAVPGKTAKDASVAAVFVAVADEKEFRGNFEVVKAGEKISEVKLKTERAAHGTSTSFLAFRNGYAVISPKSDQAAVEAAVGTGQDVSAEMAGLESWLAENDAFAVGTAAGIKYAARQGSEELKKSKDNVGGGPEDSHPPSLPGYVRESPGGHPQRNLAGRGRRPRRQAGFGSNHRRGALVKGGLVSMVVAGIPPAKENLLSGIPGGPFIFAGGGVAVPKLFEGYMSLAIGLMKNMKSIYGTSGDEMERISKESFEVVRQLRSMNFVMKTGKRGDPIYSNMYSAMPKPEEDGD